MLKCFYFHIWYIAKKFQIILWLMAIFGYNAKLKKEHYQLGFHETKCSCQSSSGLLNRTPMTFNVCIANCLCQPHTQSNGKTLNKQRVLIEGSTKVLLPASSFSDFGAAHYRLCVLLCTYRPSGL
jgi:hypothetical protein